MNDSIKKMLRLIEKDLMITEVSYETFQKKKTLIVDAVFSPAPHTCRNCGSTVVDGNGKVIVVKNGKKETIVRFEQYNHMPLVMRLKKQRYTNGKIEAKNTHIKTMKRVSYGFKSFENMRIRIFLINQLIKVR
ncbi:transposase [Enterococcus faecium]|uniref:transposase n=1 Tax=Enterococcus faecium TaxID=1352 RepID=UPI001065AEF5|nr:transposase [Enterococcus faecium]TEA56755.1 hypothetical protein CWC53_11570 [Enterococcus faecium]